MEEGPGERASVPLQLLTPIPGEKGWKVREAGDSSFDAEEDKELELKLGLGLPGVQQEDGAAAGPREKMQQLQQQAEGCSALSLGCYHPHSKLTSTGAKRGLFDTVEARSQGCNQRRQNIEGCGNELTLGGGSMAGERKKGCCPPPPASVHGSAAGDPVHSSSTSNLHGRAAAPAVVGWPPVRSFRRNLTNGGGSSKQSPERQNDEADDKAKLLICKKRPLVKINMDGIPIGRKVDLAACDSYQKLSSSVADLFRGFLQGQNDPSCAESGEQEEGHEKIFLGLLDGTGEYSLLYEDDEGDRMLVGDVPWNVFVSTTKRLRVMRRSELPHNLTGDGSGEAEC